MNTASVEELNSRLEKRGSSPISYNNFRPNILFSTSKPFGEDKYYDMWFGEFPGFHFQEGETLEARESLAVRNSAAVIIRNVKPCTRCVFTTVDPNLGEKRRDGEPLKALREYRLGEGFGNSPLFGINGAVHRMGNLKVGDAIFASLT